MKPMKKRRTLFLSGLLALALVGCAGGGTELPTTAADSEPGSSTTTAATTAKPTEPDTPKDPWHYGMWNDVKIREVTIDSGKGGDPVTVIQLTDLHIGTCTAEDLKNSTLKSTFENRKWGANGAFVPNAKASLDYADSQNPDRIVITGDAIDYLSEGSMNLLKETVWDRYRDGDSKVSRVLIALGNHEREQKMEGRVDEIYTLEEREQMVKEKWEHDILYTAVVVKDQVMVIQMDNGTGSFRNEQVPLLRADLALAREKGYTVLLFFHEPISTGNPKDRDVNASYVGKGAGTSFNFYTGSTVANPFTDPDSTNGAIYQMIVNSADVVGGVFCGHLHADYYTEIQAKTPDGQAKVIPQYVLTGTPYDKGHALKITVQ